MTKQEFAARTKRTFSDKDYEIIEYVYTHHPAIANDNGKDQIAKLHTEFGMRVIKDMYSL